jgi:hypothetical protein
MRLGWLRLGPAIAGALIGFTAAATETSPGSRRPAEALPGSVAAQSPDPGKRVAILGRPISVDAVHLCDPGIRCFDSVPSYRARYAVLEVVRGHVVDKEVTLLIHWIDLVLPQDTGPHLLVWQPASDGEPVAAGIYRLDPRAGGGWAVCGDQFGRDRFVGPPLEDVDLSPAFGNASRLSTQWARQEYPPDFYRIEADGTVHCVRGWSVDALIEFPEWVPR